MTAIAQFSYIGNPVTDLWIYDVFGSGGIPPGGFPQYRLLVDHYLAGPNHVFVALPIGSIITEGLDVPVGWVPTLAVEPLNANAAQSYYNAGPRDYKTAPTNDWSLFTGNHMTIIPSPVTFWKQVPGTSTYQLTGLGAGFPPK